MSDPRTPAGLRELLGRHGLSPKKKLGQHFLVDRNFFDYIVRKAQVRPGEPVFEVGPGPGGLSLTLLEAGADLTAVERDKTLKPVLEEVLGDRARVVFADALEYPWETVPKGSLFVANLPYNVGTPLVLKLLESGRFRDLVVMLQREVAERFAARPGGKDYGPVSLKVQELARVEKLRDVPPSVFYPPPEVTSAVVRLTPKGTRPDPGYFRFLDAAFRTRRKTLRKNLEAAGYDRRRVEAALKELGLDPKVRAEALSPETLKALYSRLSRPASTR